MLFRSCRSLAGSKVIKHLIGPAGGACRTPYSVPTVNKNRHPETPRTPRRLRGAGLYSKETERIARESWRVAAEAQSRAGLPSS